jgi:hypothetical protein
MTSFPTNLMCAAAACSIAAGNTLAERYEAEIPFTFRAGRVMMVPGRYQVWIDPASTGRIVRLHNVDSRETLLLMPAAIGGGGRDARALKLRFACGNSRCALVSMSVGEYHGAYTFHTPTLGRGDKARLADIALRPVPVD